MEALLRSHAGLTSIASGVLYGIIGRAAVDRRWGSGDWFFEMTLAFLFVVPLVIGVLTAWPIREPATRSVRPYGSTVAMLLLIAVTVAVGWEGSICVIMGGPVMIIFAGLGAWIGGFLARSAYRNRSLPVLVALPYLLAPAEARWTAPVRLVETVTEVEIAASPAAVWPLVASVDSIREHERRPALYTAMGFPRPVAATLSHHGVGGVRVATFEGGLRFTETVTVWEPNRRLRFTIEANGDSIPPGTLDEHVTLGGPHFDVLSGTYELHPIDGGRRTRLVLRSEHRIATHFNPYAAWWANRVMTSIHLNIQAVHKQRAEEARAGA